MPKPFNAQGEKPFTLQEGPLTLSRDELVSKFRDAADQYEQQWPPEAQFKIVNRMEGIRKLIPATASSPADMEQITQLLVLEISPTVLAPVKMPVGLTADSPFPPASTSTEFVDPFPVEYGMVPVGELVQEGDEYFDPTNESWSINAIRPNSGVKVTVPNTVRRKIVR